MATYYWVGGSGTWDNSSTTHWSSTSGGAGGAGFPTSGDDVFLDANSGTATISFGAAAAISCRDLDCTGFTGTLARSTPFDSRIFGSYIAGSGMHYSGTGGYFVFKSTTTGKTITMSGVSMPWTIDFAGVGGEWTLQDDLTGTSTNGLIVQDGSLKTNGKTLTIYSLVSNYSTTRTIDITDSTLNIGAGGINISNITALTFTSTGSTINFSTGAFNIASAGLTFNNVNFTGVSGAISGSNTYNVLTVFAGATFKPSNGTTQTFTSLISNGTPANLANIIANSGTFTLVSPASSTTTVRGVKLQGVTASSASSRIWIAVDSIDGGSNTNWRFFRPVGNFLFFTQ